jgi:hypothetical protein
MPVQIFNGNAYFAIPMPLADFPKLLTDFLAENPDTSAIETLAAQLEQSNFPPASMEDFVTCVCEWGGRQGTRILSRILKRNSEMEIADALRNASSSLARGQLVDALTHVDKLRYLDVSFASKHLRFLRPDICPVLDSYLHDALPYTLDASGYSDFAQDCAWLGNQLVANHIPNPRQRTGGAWYVADVEGAIYMLVTS